MKKYLLFITGFLIMLLGACSSAQKADEVQPPNILWLIAEDLSPDLGCYGNELVQTPTLNELAENGVRFTNVFTAAPICTPSRTALAVGMHQGSINAHHMRYPDTLQPALPENVKTIVQLFQDHGYATANILDAPGNGKIDWSFQADLNQQFNYNHWQQIASQKKPFFAQLNIRYTHRAFPESTDIPLEKINIPPYYPDHPVAQEDWARYYKSIEVLDTKVEQVMDSLKHHNLIDNTIVIFFSDHGRPMIRGKCWLYDSGIKIPMIISIPEQMTAPAEYQKGQINHQFISSLDISATTLAIAGIEKPENMHGKVFWGENKDDAREYIFSASDRSGEIFYKSRAVRSNQLKYIRNYNHDFSINEASTAYRKAMHPIYHLLNILHDKDQLTEAQQYLVKDLPEEEFYDLENDPYETNNLINDEKYTQEIDHMRQVLYSHLKEIDDKGLLPDSQSIIDAFDQYGKESYSARKEKIAELHREVLKEVEKDHPL